MRRTLLLFPLGLLIPMLTSCDNDCDFFERCNGNIREICGEGPDQMFHRRVAQYPCEVPNGSCVEVNDDIALCVQSPPTTCDSTFQTTCQDNLRIYCTVDPYLGAVDYPTQYVVAEDCAASGKRCALEGELAVCQ